MPQNDKYSSINQQNRYIFGNTLQSFAFVSLFMFLSLSLSPREPPRWPNGKGVLLESGGPELDFQSAVDLFSRSRHTSGLKISTPAATLQGAWRYRIRAETSWPGISIL